MGHRLSKIYTRTGDGGTTGLADGSRVEKDHPRVEAIGTVDELNSTLGLLRAEPLPAGIESALDAVQHTLFELGAELSTPGSRKLGSDAWGAIEAELDHHNATLPPLREFILPAGGRAAALAHLARTVCRRAERRVYTLSKCEEVNRETLTYLNRLSDLLFVIARLAARHDQGSEVAWQPRQAPE